MALKIDDQEYSQRTKKLRSLIEREGLDVYIAGTVDNAYYLSGLRRSFSFAIPFFCLIQISYIYVLIENFSSLKPRRILGATGWGNAT